MGNNKALGDGQGRNKTLQRGGTTEKNGNDPFDILAQMALAH